MYVNSRLNEVTSLSALIFALQFFTSSVKS